MIRLTCDVELAVHDPARLIIAAAAAGWEPLPGQDRPHEDPQDLIGAAMWLFEDASDLPGCEMLSDESTGEVLNHDANRDRDHPTPRGVPDFAGLFPIGLGDGEVDWELTARTADVLHSSLSMLADGIYDDVEELADGPLVELGRYDTQVLDRIPRVCWRQDALWRKRLAHCADALAEDLAQGRLPSPRCTGEEVCLHLAIGDARDAVNDAMVPDRIWGFPEHPDDFGWQDCLEFLFEDHDVLMLFDPDLDGIEDPESDLAVFLRTASLHPRDWFTPFANVEPRNPQRAFRR